MPLLRPRLLPLALLPPLLAAGCGGTQLSQSWQLDRLRVLGVRAIPAEPRPGETVRFESLTYLPDGTELELTTWFACLPQSADDFGCDVDASAFEALAGQDMEDLTPEEQAALFEELLEAGLIGAEPILAPTWTTPVDALDGLEETERLEGLSAVVNITAIPAGATGQSDLELAYKRLPISEAETPNHNPELTGFVVDGVEVPLGGTVPWTWGRPLEIDPVLSDDSIEPYLFRDADGTDVERVEEPFVTWYTEGGSFDQEYSLHPETLVAWTPPPPPTISALLPWGSSRESVEVIAVVRDRRGGMAWGRLTIALRSAGVDDARPADTGSPDTGRQDTGAADTGAADTGAAGDTGADGTTAGLDLP